MRLENQSFAILVENQYEDQEFWYPYQRLREEGAEVIVVGPKAGVTYKSKYGYPVESQISPDEIDLASIAGIVIPGGYAPDHMRADEAMVSLVRDAFAEGKIVAAICHAGWMLCSAGILEGRRATSYFTIKDDMRNAGARWINKEVVQDDNLITSRSPDDLPVFIRTIIGAASVEKTMAEVV